MANKYNKIIYGGKTLIDLTADTVTPDKLLKGTTAHDKSGETITGTCAFDSNTQDATIAVAEMLEGKTAYARGTKLTGTMPNNASLSGTLTSKTQEFTIAQGYHDGSGKVKLDATEMSKLIPSNIREGVSILGVIGAMDDLEGVKAQEKSVTPSTIAQTILPDEDYNYLTQVTVAAIPYVESDNAAGGITVTIG
jgi:hypothetical protein